MAREIKFRFWNHASKSFCFDRLIDSDGDIFKQSPAFDDYYCELNECGEVTACQYTGLTDKNGKEIYEGDYVKVTSHTPAFCQFGNDKDCEGIVDFLECGFVVTDHKTFARPLFTEICDIEVIGNIYENPELI